MLTKFNDFQYFIVTETGRCCAHNRQHVLLEIFEDLFMQLHRPPSIHTLALFKEYLPTILDDLLFVAWVDSYNVADIWKADSKNDVYPYDTYQKGISEEAIKQHVQRALFKFNLTCEKIDNLISVILEKHKKTIYVNEYYGDSTTFGYLCLNERQLKAAIDKIS